VPGQRDALLECLDCPRALQHHVDAAGREPARLTRDQRHNIAIAPARIERRRGSQFLGQAAPALLPRDQHDRRGPSQARQLYHHLADDAAAKNDDACARLYPGQI